MLISQKLRAECGSQEAGGEQVQGEEKERLTSHRSERDFRNYCTVG